MGGEGSRLSGLQLVREATRNGATRCKAVRSQTLGVYGSLADTLCIAGPLEQFPKPGVARSILAEGASETRVAQRLFPQCLMRPRRPTPIASGFGDRVS